MYYVGFKVLTGTIDVLGVFFFSSSPRFCCRGQRDALKDD